MNLAQRRQGAEDRRICVQCEREFDKQSVRPSSSLERFPSLRLGGLARLIIEEARAGLARQSQAGYNRTAHGVHMQWLIAAVFGIPGLLLVIANYVYLLQWLLTKHSASMFPIAGGVLVALALACSPLLILRSYWWIGLFVDPGCGLLLTGFIVTLLPPRSQSK
jgi:hypothetical protein